MKIITATELARNVDEILERVVVEREEIVIESNHREVARLVPSPKHLTALEAMSDIYGTLPEEAAATWEADSRATGLKAEHLPKGIRNP